jgi:Na+-transporting methylmalonyl-CoA/oxaloacetate decarboxylase beta subunit
MLSPSVAIQVMPGLLVRLTEVVGGDLHGLVADEALYGVSAVLGRLHQLLILLFARRPVGSETSAVRILGVASQSAVFPVTTFLAAVLLGAYSPAQYAYM